MGTAEILKEIKKLPINKRMLVVEQTLKSIREKEAKEKMTLAVDTLLDDYKYDKDLIAFTQIDYEAFYEAR